MFEKFTDRARRVVVLAQEEARMLSHDYIGTEHLLLGLIHEGEGVAAQALESLGISLEDARAQVEAIVPRGQEPLSGHIPFTPRAKKVLELPSARRWSSGTATSARSTSCSASSARARAWPPRCWSTWARTGPGSAQQVMQLIQQARGGRERGRGRRGDRRGRLPPDVRHRGLARPARAGPAPAATDRRPGWPPSSGTWAWRRGRAAGEPGAPEEPGRPRSPARPGSLAPPEDHGPAAEAGPQGGLTARELPEQGGREDPPCSWCCTQTATLEAAPPLPGRTRHARPHPRFRGARHRGTGRGRALPPG